MGWALLLLRVQWPQHPQHSSAEFEENNDRLYFCTGLLVLILPPPDVNLDSLPCKPLPLSLVPSKENIQYRSNVQHRPIGQAAVDRHRPGVVTLQDSIETSAIQTRGYHQ
jgi:hypothetical protein